MVLEWSLGVRQEGSDEKSMDVLDRLMRPSGRTQRHSVLEMGTGVEEHSPILPQRGLVFLYESGEFPRPWSAVTYRSPIFARNR